MLVYSQLVQAQLENSASDLSSTSIGLTYYNTASNVVKWYTGAAWLTAADLTSTQTLANKTLTSATLTSPTINTPTINTPVIAAGTATGLTHLSVNDTGGFNLRLRGLSASPTLSADRILTFNVNDASRTISLDGSVTVGEAFVTTGGALTLNANAGGSSITFPTTGTVATLAGTEILSNKTHSGNLLLQNTVGTQPELHFGEDPANGTSVMKFKAAPDLAADFTLEWPVDDGNASQVLSTNGSGVLSWVSASTVPATPGIVYSDGAALLTTAMPFATNGNKFAGVNSLGTNAELKSFAVDTSAPIGWTHTANVITLNLPDAASGARGVVTTGTQSFGGDKTFLSNVTIQGTLTGRAIAPDTDNTYDIGTGVAGYRSLFLSNGSGNTAKFIAGTLAGDITLTTPTATGTLATVPAAGSVYSDGAALQSVTFTANGDKIYGVNSGATALEVKDLSMTSAGVATIGPTSSDSTAHNMNGSLAFGTVIPSWSDTARRYIGSKFGSMQVRDGDNTAGGAGFGAYAGAYLDGTTTRLSSSSLYASSLFLTTNSSSVNTGWLFRSYNAGAANDAVSVAGSVDAGLIAFDGGWTLGPSGGATHRINGATQLNGGVLTAATSDGSDTSGIFLYGGGAASATRGAQINIYGNEHSTNPGQVGIYSGDTQTGTETSFIIGNSGGSTKLLVQADGGLIIGGNSTGDANFGTIDSVSNSHYYEGTFVANFNSGLNTGTNNVTVRYRRIGRQVFLTIPSLLATAQATTNSWDASGTPIPSSLRAGAGLVLIGPNRVSNATNDYVTGVGYLITSTSGAMLIRMQTNWVNTTANCGFDGFTVSYYT